MVRPKVVAATVLVSVCAASCASSHRTATPVATTTGSTPSPQVGPRPDVTSLPTGTKLIDVPASPADQWSGDVARIGTAIWANGAMFRIDPASNAVTRLTADPAASTPAFGVGEGPAGTWGTSFDANLVRKFDPGTGKSLLDVTMPNDSGPGGFAVTTDAVWVGMHHKGTVVRLDPATGRVVATIQVGPSGDNGPSTVVSAQGAIWVSVQNANAVVRIDPRTNRVVARVVPSTPELVCGPLAATATVVWASGCGDELSAIDPATNKVRRTLHVGGRFQNPVADGTDLLLVVGATSPASTRVLHIAASGNVVKRTNLGDKVTIGGAALTATDLWLGDGTYPFVLRIPLTSLG